MTWTGAQMAAQNFMDSPGVKAAISLASTLLAALILYVCSNLTSGISNLTTKLENVQASISGLATTIALTQRDVKGLEEGLKASRAETKELRQDVTSLQMRLGQLEKGGK